MFSELGRNKIFHC